MAKKFDVKQLREKVLSSDDIIYDTVYIEAWDVELPVKSLSSSEMKEVMKHEGDYVRMAIVSVINGCKTEDGEAVFEGKDLAKLEKDKSFTPISEISEKILELSGHNPEAGKEAKNN